MLLFEQFQGLFSGQLHKSLVGFVLKLRCLADGDGVAVRALKHIHHSEATDVSVAHTLIVRLYDVDLGVIDGRQQLKAIL